MASPPDPLASPPLSFPPPVPLPPLVPPLRLSRRGGSAVVMVLPRLASLDDRPAGRGVLPPLHLHPPAEQREQAMSRSLRQLPLLPPSAFIAQVGAAEVVCATAAGATTASTAAVAAVTTASRMPGWGRGGALRPPPPQGVCSLGGPAEAGYAAADGNFVSWEGACPPRGPASVEPALMAGGSDEQLRGAGIGVLHTTAGGLRGVPRQVYCRPARGGGTFIPSLAMDPGGSQEGAARASAHAPSLPALRIGGAGNPSAVVAAQGNVNFEAGPSRAAPYEASSDAAGPPVSREKKVTERCGTCFAQFTTKCHLNIHIKTVHLGMRPWQCEFCGVSFGQKGSLTRHISAVHLKKRPHQCERCPKAFGEHWTLLVHVRNVHEGLRPHSCHLCNRRFGTYAHCGEGEGWGGGQAGVVNVGRERDCGVLVEAELSAGVVEEGRRARRRAWIRDLADQSAAGLCGVAYPADGMGSG